MRTKSDIDGKLIPWCVGGRCDVLKGIIVNRVDSTLQPTTRRLVTRCINTDS